LLTVINAAKLALLTILTTLFLLGQGWLLVGPSLHRSIINRKIEISRSQEISLMMIGGLVINYGLTVIIQSLKISMIVGGILSIVGLVLYLVTFIRSFKQISFSVHSFFRWCGIILVCSLFLGPIISIPLLDWDALSIWYLHSKMIYAAGSFSQLSGWQHPSVVFSHVDYPNLVPALGAQIAFLLGYWNEYLPKLSLFFLLVPAVILLFTFFKRSFSFLFLIIVILFSIASRFWDGYMDGYLSLYFALSMLLLGRYFKEMKPMDLVSSIFCLIIPLYLKNEGVLAVIAGFVAVIFSLISQKTKLVPTKNFRDYWKFFLVLFILFIPFFVWNHYKLQWGLTSDLELDSSHSFSRMLSRFQDGSYKLILSNTNFELKNALMLFGILLSALIAVRKRLPKEIFPVIIGAAIYCLGIMAIYLITPHDLSWHLHNSIYRTLLSVNASLFVVCFFLMSALEKNEDPNASFTDHVNEE